MNADAFDPQAHNVDELLALYRLEAEDFERIRTWGKEVSHRIPEIIEKFYDWLRRQPEYEEFIDDEDVERRLQRAQISYLERFMACNVDAEYVRSRARVGVAHARIGLPLHSYFGSTNHMLLIFVEEFLAADSPNRDATVVSIVKLMHFDMAIVAETYGTYSNDRVAAQSKALLEMSTPVTEVWGGVLMLPIVGIIDSARAQDIMRGALVKISASRARVFIMDISGVAVVDTAVANYLIKVTRATQLMGCECIVSGVSPAIAETIVELGINVGTMVTTGTLMQALTLAFRRVGVQVVERGT